MTYNGHIENGVVIFDRKVKLPDGTAVTIRRRPKSKKTRGKGTKRTPKTLYESAKKMEKREFQSPPDLAEHHDEYLNHARRDDHSHSLAEKLLQLADDAAKIDDNLPEDFAEKHDHYLRIIRSGGRV